MMSRRLFLRATTLAVCLGALWGASSTGALAQTDADGTQAATTSEPGESSDQVALVELVNLHCPRCRAVNLQANDIDQAARAAGITYRVAPLAYTSQSPWPDRVYYAARDLYPGSEAYVRDALFAGIQDDGETFEDLPQVLTYLQSEGIVDKIKQKFPDFRLSEVETYANTEATLLPEVKAARLVSLSGATQVPVFIWVRDGQVLDVVKPKGADDSAQDVLQPVLQKLRATAGGTPLPAQGMQVPVVDYTASPDGAAASPEPVNPVPTLTTPDQP
jgi:hypothetical protein